MLHETKACLHGLYYLSTHLISAKIARGGNPITASSQSKGKGKADEPKEGNWEEWGGAWISFYVNPKTQKPPAASRAGPKEPTTPTPARRSSLHHSQLLSGSSQNISSSSSRGRTTDEAPVESESTITGGLQTLEVPYSMLEGAPNLESIVEASISELPSDAHYEFLHRLRVASALTGDAETRRKILAVRILALTNLAYIFTEQQFSQKVLTVDQDEPRRLQIVYQLAELVQASDKTSQSGEVPLWLQTLALGALEAFARHKPRAADVCAALSVNVNHGVLLYILRKFVAGLSSEDGDEDSFDVEEWRDALFSLISFLPGTSHTGSLLVSAGLIPILVELINLRTQRALRQIPKALNLLDQLIYGVATAFQTFANAKGLDAVVDLAADQTQQGLVEVEQGQGVPYSHRAELTDYKISHRRQQTLKMVTKLMQNMMTQSGAGVDRLLRNLIDNPKLLEAIRLVIARGTIWGSSIWSTVVGMVSAFIHNEPTSYAVIHEAHITHTFLEAITGKTGLVEDEARRKKIEEARKRRQEEAERLGEAEEGGSGQHSTAVVSSSEPDANDRMDATPKPATDMASEIEEPSLTRSSTAGTCIMPSQDSIGSIPTAIGAICLNPLGLELIQASSALSSFFEIFESPAHVKLLIDGELDNLLGTQFDELVRHHPNLGQSVMDSTLRLLDRVAEIGKLHAVEHGIGAKIWLDDGHGGLFVSGGRAALSGRTVDPSVLTTAKGSGLSDGQAKGNDSEDVEMSDADAFTPTVAAAESQLEAGLLRQ
jgi:E3 ubiquitin-protein ligase HUWE1